MSKAVSDVWVKSIGEKRGAPYIYFDGFQAIRAGFSPGQKYDLRIEGNAVVLTVNDDGSRKVSSKKRNDTDMPIVDINSKELLSLFDGMTQIRVVVREGEVYLLPLASEIKKKERLDRISAKMNSGEALDMASLSHGGGVLSHAIHEGLHEAGIAASLVFANEIREDLLIHAGEHNDAWNEKTAALSMPMQELAQDDWLMQQLPKIDILEMGLPCSGASRAGASKRGLEKMEDHPEVGHLAFSALMILHKIQPAVVLLENVPEYQSTASAMILRHQLRDMGYHVHEAILAGKDFGCMENRVRWCMVAVTDGLDFNIEQLQPVVTLVKRLGDYLDPNILPDDPRYRAVNYLKEKMGRDAGKGNSFAMQFITEDSTSVPTIRKGYMKGGSTDPRLKNTVNPELSRLLTGAEHARVKGVPPSLIEGLSDSVAHQLLGQGILYDPFKAVGQRVGECLEKAVGAKLRLTRVKNQDNGPSFGIG